MLKWCKSMLKKHYEILAYLFFGVLTTALNWIVHFALTAYFSANADFSLQGTVASSIAWAVAVVFAFFTNKPFVFRSLDWSARVAWPEFLKFVGCRLISGALEILLIFLTVDLMHMNGYVMKIVISVFVVIINYIGSKLLFHK